MYLDFAPLEGITTSLFRRIHHQFFPGVDRYYSPFLSPTQDHRFTPREKIEFYPEYNQDISLIPQILTKKSEDFLWAAKEFSSMGYQEVNLNLGCPSGTVTAKGKGCGMLTDLSVLKLFLDHIFDQTSCQITIKTRLGVNDPDEFLPVLDLFGQYPVSELIVHPRIRRDFYRHPIRIEYFDYAIKNYKNPISYNGSILNAHDYSNCSKKYPNLKSVMIGQALVSDPALAHRIKYHGTCTKDQIREFHDSLLTGYTLQFGNELNAMKRMKDVWFYLARIFENSERQCKRILKAKYADEYRQAVNAIFSELSLLSETSGGW